MTGPERQAATIAALSDWTNNKTTMKESSYYAEKAEDKIKDGLAYSGSSGIAERSLEAARVYAQLAHTAALKEIAWDAKRGTP